MEALVGAATYWFIIPHNLSRGVDGIGKSVDAAWEVYCRVCIGRHVLVLPLRQSSRRCFGLTSATRNPFKTPTSGELVPHRAELASGLLAASAARPISQKSSLRAE